MARRHQRPLPYPSLSRIDLDEEVLRMVEDMCSSILHAPLQTGNSAIHRALANRLNATGEYRYAYASVEVGQAAREDVAIAMVAILEELGSCADTMLRDTLLGDAVRSAHSMYAADAEFLAIIAR